MSFNRLSYSGGAIQTTLASDIASGDTTLALTASTNWPGGSTGPFYLVVYALNNGVRTNEEKMLATSRSSTTLAGLTRGVDGTSALSHTAGEIIEHVFTATEADEANRAVNSTLGAVTAKGDLTPATSAGTLGKLAAGANGLPLVADNAQTTGLSYAALGAAGIAAGAVVAGKLATASVVAANIVDATITTAKLSWHVQTFSVTSGSGGDTVIPHGAGFTPSAVFITFTHPFALPNAVSGFVLQTLDGTNASVKISASQSGSVAGTLASGQTVAGTIMSLP